jgi:hypothetical protein
VSTLKTILAINVKTGNAKVRNNTIGSSMRTHTPIDISLFHRSEAGILPPFMEAGQGIPFMEADSFMDVKCGQNRELGRSNNPKRCVYGSTRHGGRAV